LILGYGVRDHKVSINFSGCLASFASIKWKPYPFPQNVAQSFIKQLQLLAESGPEKEKLRSATLWIHIYVHLTSCNNSFRVDHSDTRKNKVVSIVARESPQRCPSCRFLKHDNEPGFMVPVPEDVPTPKRDTHATLNKCCDSTLQDKRPYISSEKGYERSAIDMFVKKDGL